MVNELKRTRKIGFYCPMVNFINEQVVVATADGSLTILTETLELRKKISDDKKHPRKTINSLRGNESFIASGDGSGTIRFYKQNDDDQPKV